MPARGPCPGNLQSSGCSYGQRRFSWQIRDRRDCNQVALKHSSLDRGVSQVLLIRDRGAATAQNVFLNLAGSGLRQFVNKRHRVWRLEVSQIGAREFAQFAFRRAARSMQDNESMWRLAPTLIRQPDNRSLPYCWMTQ